MKYHINYPYIGRKIYDGIGYLLFSTLILTTIFGEPDFKSKPSQNIITLENIANQDSLARAEEDKWKDFQEKQYEEWANQCKSHSE